MPGVAAGEVDHHVDPALVAAALRLAVALDRPFGEIDLFVVDDFVGAEFLEPGELLCAARAGDHLGAQHLGEDDAAGADPAARAQHQHPPPPPPPAPSTSTRSPASTVLCVMSMRCAVP